MIRKSEQKDNKEIAKLIYIIWDGMNLEMIDHFEKGKVLSAIETCLADEDFINSERTIHVYEKDGAVAGCVVTYPGHTEFRFKRVWEKLKFDEVFKPYSPPLEVKEARDDEMYIDSVVTFDKYRGQGIATQLLKYLLDSKNDRPWGLICEVENEKALNLYLKMGFIKDEIVNLYGHDYYHMTYKNI